ncbi:MAG TPA: efflux transporter outer membrane subunit [Steroidobacteraceae bacterium]|nr:efflux transporter outer membrane subunit [Steroidobacteraceae bacterium]
MRRAAFFPSAVLALAAGCAVGPNYHRPSAPVPQTFKEADGWKPAEPRDAASASEWWTVFNDPVLNDLEKQIDVSNQTLKASEAAWREARALVSSARAQYFPTISVTAAGSRSGARSTVTTGGAAGSTGGAVASSPTARPFNTFEASAGATWDIDIWGKIRRTVESQVANAQASEADLAAARLSAQATLAIDYADLRVADETKKLLDDTVEAFGRSLQITQNQYKVGVVAKADVITAQTQYEGAKSNQLAIGVTRATLEHAIAVLVGKPPADFSLAPAEFGAFIPVAPSGVPSSLLERNPTVAAAERSMAAANAQIGVAIAAYFPDLTLSGSYGYAADAVSNLFRAPNVVWSFGGNATETLLDFGARSARVRQTRAAYDLAVANYRQAVLTAFQQVEDQLATLRILEAQYAVQDTTVKSANEAVRLILNEYKAGTVAYTAVVTVQAIALSDAQQLLQIRQSRLNASVALIQALGGGWDAATLGSAEGTAAQLASKPGHTP